MPLIYNDDDGDDDDDEEEEEDQTALQEALSHLSPWLLFLQAQ